MGRSRHTTVIVALSLLLLLSYIEAQSTIHVIQSEEQCSPHQMCYTLEGLANFSQTDNGNFSMNTTLLFSHGTHLIGNNIGSTRRLTIQGIQQLNLFTFSNNFEEKLPRCLIQCSSPFSFEFRNITKLAMSGITLDKCGSLHKFHLLLNNFNMSLTLLVKNVVSFIAENVGIINTKGLGLFIGNVHPHLSLSKMNLSNNEVNCYILQSFHEKKTTNLNYSIADSTFAYGNITKNPYSVIIGSSGLRIEITESGTMQFINNTHHENIGHFGNFYLKLIRGTAMSVSIKQLTSAYAGLSSYTGIALKCKPNDTSSRVEITNSTFNNSCIKFWGTYTILKNVTIRNCNSIGLYFHKTNCTIFGNMNIIEKIGKFRYTIMSKESTIKILEQLQVQNNFAGAKLKRSTLIFGVYSKVHLINNTAISPYSYYADGSVILAEDSDIIVLNGSYIKFRNNTSKLGGAITLVNSTIKILDSYANLHFIKNTGTNGGAVAMYDGSQILVQGSKHNILRFIGNRATQTGGAIYVNTPSYLVRNRRSMIEFIKLETITRQCPIIEYRNNTAKLSGDSVYGGWLKIRKYKNRPNCQLIHSKNKNYSLLSSDPIRVCICSNNSLPNCSIVEHNVEIFPRKKFKIKAVAVGWEFGTVPSTVHARIEDNRRKITKLKVGQDVKSVGRHCTNLTYKVYSSNKKERLQLLVENENIPDDIPKSTLLRHNLVINISMKECPPGFLLNNTCTCHHFLIENNIKCNMELYKVERNGQVWIKGSIIQTHNIIISKYCPQKYCKSSDKLKQLDLDYPNSQCASNRSGTLCGSCSPGLSQVFGTSNCKKCSSLWVLLIVPVFIVAGVALVVFIMVLNLTVTVGTINGLILYANIIRANQDIFFPPDISNSFLSWYIAWINLDFGTEACFFDGMDAYVKTWLQFLFPLYIWFIVIAIIVLSSRFDRIAKLCGKNAVPVLATLYLLSYAKVLRVIITVLQSTTLLHSDGHTTAVWTYDGNVDYLEGKHISLFTAALLLLLFLSLPYTAILLTIQWLQKWSEHCLLFWVNRLKPLFDAYTGPYKDNHRYWTGLLLLVRALLFVIFALNVSNDPSVNLLAIVIVLGLTISIPFVTGKVYKSQLVNIIEHSFLFNITILAGVMQYQIHSTSTISKWPTTLSASVAFITFIAIVFKHLIQKIMAIKKISSIWTYIVEMIKSKGIRHQALVNANETQKEDSEKHELQTVTSTFVQLREPLLDD